MDLLHDQRSWEIVRTEVCKVVLNFLNHGNFDNSLNATYIALIPKIKNPARIAKYRPINLCNVFYKLIAKVLANRIKQILPNIIFPA